jgi:hypothetical protein
MDTYTLKKSHDPKQIFHLTIVSIKHPAYNTHFIKKEKKHTQFPFANGLNGITSQSIHTCRCINGLQGDLNQIPKNRKNTNVSVFPHNNNMQPILEVETQCRSCALI